MSPLRRRMNEDMQIRNLTPNTQPTGCGFLALPIRGEPDGSVDGAKSPCLCDDSVSLVTENQHSYHFEGVQNHRVDGAIAFAVRNGAPLAEVA